jgi:small conductance mechanosensitive channel
MPMKELSTDLILRYGLQALSATVILIIGILFAKWAGNVAYQRLNRVEMEPPVRMLLVRIIKILVLALTAMIVLDQVGVPIAPLIAGIGVAGLGVGFALQGDPKQCHGWFVYCLHKTLPSRRVHFPAGRPR